MSSRCSIHANLYKRLRFACHVIQSQRVVCSYRRWPEEFCAQTRSAYTFYPLLRVSVSSGHVSHCCAGVCCMQQRQLPDTGESGVQRQKKWEGGKGSREKGWAGPEKRIGIPDGACVRACVQVVLVLVLPSMPICVLGGGEREEEKKIKQNKRRETSI